MFLMTATLKIYAEMSSRNVTFGLGYVWQLSEYLFAGTGEAE
jgi:hypothetical protein